MTTSTEKNLTREQALELVGTDRNGGTVIGIDSSPGRSYPAGLYLVIVFKDKRAEYEKVG